MCDVAISLGCGQGTGQLDEAFQYVGFAMSFQSGTHKVYELKMGDEGTIVVIKERKQEVAQPVAMGCKGIWMKLRNI